MVERKQKSAFVVDVAEQNKSHASDFYYAVQISVRLLKPIGAWPLANDETSRFKIITHKVSMIIALFLFTFTIAPWIADTMKEKWSVFLILRLCPLFFTMTVFARYILLVWHQEQLRSCIDHVADDWQCVIIPKDREIMLENARMGRTFGTFSVAFMFSCGALYYTLPIVSLNTIDEDNMTVRLHPSPCELIVCDCQASPVYEIAYFLQFLCGYTAYSTFCGICSLIANFVMHVCGQCDVLVSIFEETVDGGEHNNGPIDSRIATAVTRHLRLLKLVSNVSGLFTEICLVEFINASCNICLLGSYIIIDLNNNESFVQIFMYVFGLVSIIFNIFMFCYIGDLLKECCQNVGTACYAMEWYRMPPKKAIELIMPIAMSRYPATLTAGKLLSMTLATFSDILKTSLAYFNLFHEFYSRNDMKA
ncbi:odorant receptor 10-like [Linepithema humile]|uniref:odorant receptor 10-like n=1 Tax=Linepithema humile TaxID=83485 RepID=UPI00351E8DA1